MREYVVFECSRTLELCEDAREHGFDTWVPVRIERRRIERRKDHKIVGVELRDVRTCAMTGYIFVPIEVWRQFQEWSSFRYHAIPLLEHVAPAGSVGHVHKAMVRPVTVALEELTEMDRTLRGEWEVELARWSGVREEDPPPPPPVAAVVYQPGQRVRVVRGLLKGLEGTVCKAKGLDVRLEIRERFVSMPNIWVEPL